MKMMKKLAVLILSCIMSMQAYCCSCDEELKERRGHKRPAHLSIDAEQVYMYPNTKPKLEHIFTLDLSGKEWEEVDNERKQYDISQTIVEIFNKEDFVVLPGFWSNPRSLKRNKITTTLGKFIGSKLETCVIIGMEYRPRSIRFNLESDVCVLNVNKTCRLLNKKWSIRPMKGEPEIIWPNLEDAHHEYCNELSWKWVDCFIHSMVSNMDDYNDEIDPHKAKFLKSLYGKIKKNGLENTVMRIAVSANDAGFYSFNAVYETEQQREVVRNFLKELQQKLVRNS